MSRLGLQTAHFFFLRSSRRYNNKAMMLETEPKIPITSIMHEVICTTSPEKISREGLTHASFPRLAGGWGATVFSPEGETLDFHSASIADSAKSVK